MAPDDRKPYVKGAALTDNLMCSMQTPTGSLMVVGGKVSLIARMEKSAG